MRLKFLILLLALFSFATVVLCDRPVQAIAPSTVGTTTEEFAIGNQEGFNQGEFFAAGRFWVYYSDGKNELMTSSTDGITWSSLTVIRANSDGSGFSGTFDGTYFHYVEGGPQIMYRRGVPNGDGTITWSAQEQPVQDCRTGVNACDDAAIAVDTAGYVWVGYSTPLSDCNHCLPSFPYVTKNARTDGTWSTALGFPFQLSNTPSGGTGIGDWGETIVPLTSQKVYVIYGHGPTYVNGTGSSPILGRLYNGGFGPQETATSSFLFANMRFSSAVANGDDVYLVFVQPNTLNMNFVERTAATGTWSQEVTVQPGTTTHCTSPSVMYYCSVPALSIDGSGNLYLFWMGEPNLNAVYYRQYHASTAMWDTNPTVLTTETSIYDNRNIMVYATDFGGYLGVTYEAGSQSPYNIRFTFLNLSSTTTPTMSITSLASVTSTMGLTSSASTTSGSRTSVSSTTTTSTGAPSVTNTLSTTTTTTGSFGGTSTTTLFSPISTSYSTTSSITSSTTTVTQTGTTTTGTLFSTTTSTGTSFSTTTSTGAVTVTETDTYNILLTQLFQELEQFEGFILQTLGFQVKATPVGRQVNQIIVTVRTPTTTPTVTATVSSTQTITQTTILTSSSTSTSATTMAAPVSVTSTQSPAIIGTISTTVTTVSFPTGTFTATFTQILSTSTSTSRITVSTFTTTLQTVLKTSTTSATVTSSSTSFSTTTSSGTVKVTQTDIFTQIITSIIQLLHQLVTEIIKILHVNATIVKTPKGRIVHRVTVVK